MSSEKNDLLDFNQNMKLDKIPYIIYADIESFIKIIGEHIPCGYSLPTILAFNDIQNKHVLYCEKDCIKEFYESLREHAKNLIYFENKKCYC